jgi:hypothetical protein
MKNKIIKNLKKSLMNYINFKKQNEEFIFKITKNYFKKIFYLYSKIKIFKTGFHIYKKKKILEILMKKK